MPELQLIAHGEPQWDSKVNDAIKCMNQALTIEETDSVTLLDGWTNDTQATKLKKIPLINGSALVVFQFDAYKTMQPGEVGYFAVIPDGYGLSLNFEIGGQIPVQYNGHIGGYVDLYTDGSKIGYHFFPNNGSIDGDANKPQKVSLAGSVAWI